MMDDQSPDGEPVAPAAAASAGDQKRAATGRGEETDEPKAGGGGRTEREAPPDDDVCPICFGVFTVPCKTACGHWYCANCILTYWRYSASPRACRCPMCLKKIHFLIPQESLLQLNDDEVAKVLGEVGRYNHLCIGGVRGAVQQARQAPVYIKTYFQRLVNRAMDPDRFLPITELRLLLIVIVIVYRLLPLEFIPIGETLLSEVEYCHDRIIVATPCLKRTRLVEACLRIGVLQTDTFYVALAIALVLRIIGILRSRRRAQRARQLGNLQAH